MTGAGPPTEVVLGMLDAMWRRQDPRAVERYFAPALHRAIEDHRREILAGFSGFRVEVGQTVCEGDAVFARLVLHGEHTGTFAGVPATGRTVSWESARRYSVLDGTIVEAWGLQDRLGLLQQMGVVDDAVG